MKELSIEEKARAYDEALRNMQELINNANKQGHIIVRVEDVENSFPGLKESENERIREALIRHIAKISTEIPVGALHRINGVDIPDLLAWIEKQGEQKTVAEWSEEDKRCIRDCIFYLKSAKNHLKKDDSILWNEKWFDLCIAWLEKQYNKPQEKIDNANKVEQKFKVGDWVVYCGQTYQITSLNNNIFTLTSCNGSYFFNKVKSTKEPVFHLWTIKDAKQGDVLAYVTDEDDLWIMIYWSLYEPYEGHVHYHALLVKKALVVSL